MKSRSTSPPGRSYRSALACVALLGTLLAADPSSATSPQPLTRIEEIRELVVPGDEVGIPIRVEGTVTYADRVWGFLLVQQGEHGLFVKSDRIDMARSGDLVSIEGRANLRSGLPTARARSIEVIGRGEIPPPTPVDLEEMAFGENDAARVRTEGVVIQALVQERRTRLVLRSGETLFYATVAGSFGFEEVEGWIGGTVEVTGALAYYFSSDSGEFEAYQVFLDRPDDLTWKTPMQVERKTARSYGRTIALPREPGLYSVHAQITYTDSKRVIVESNDQAISIDAETTLGLKPGQVVRASIESLSPDWDRYQLRLIQPLTSTPLPDAIDFHADLRLRGQDYRRVRMSGELESWEPFENGVRITLRQPAGSIVVLFRGPGESMEELALESVVELSAAGIFFPHGLGAGDHEPKIVTEQLSDLQVESRRAMLDLPTVLAVGGAIALLCLVLLLWIRYLRKRVSEKTAYLSRVSAQLRSSYEAIRDGLVAVDSSGHVLAVNARARELFELEIGPGTRVEELRSAMAQCSESDEEFERMWERSVESSTANPRISSWTTLYPERRILSVWSAPFTESEQGDEFGRLWVFRDVTHERTLESNIQKVQKLDAIGTLAGGIAHDFNNLLTVISGNLAMLRTEMANWPDADITEQLSSAEGATHRAAAVAGRLLTLAQRSEIELEPSSVNQVIERLSVLLTRALGSRYELERSLPDDLPLVNADTNLLEQVVLNLCVNARDAMPHGGTITVRTEAKIVRGEKWVVIAVRDSGHGISPEVRERVFEPFFSTKGEGRGSGLGLAVSYGVIRQHGGEIEFDSRVGVGTEFRVLLPACGPHATPAPARKRVEPEKTGSAHVLVVDDEPAVRAIAERILRHHGNRVTSADDGEQALEILEREAASIEVVLLDLTMPGLNGVEVFARIRKLYPGLSVVLCSGYSLTQAVEGIQPPPEHFVRKPYAVADLMEAISGAAASNRVGGSSEAVSA